jgi:hypothetical protein
MLKSQKMNRFTIIIDKLNDDTLSRVSDFLKDASQIEGVTVDKENLSVILEKDKVSELLALTDKYGIADLTNKR